MLVRLPPEALAAALQGGYARHSAKTTGRKQSNLLNLTQQRPDPQPRRFGSSPNDKLLRRPSLPPKT